MEERERHGFRWSDLGDIRLGRPNLGQLTDVAVYRLMQYTLRSVLISKYGPEAAGDILYEAGRLAGTQFCLNVLDTGLDFDRFMADFHQKMLDLNIGVLRVEKADLEKMECVLTMEEDLDCSGLPVTDETVCDYDEGFLSGVLGCYTGREFKVREVDCWASGERICRFSAKASQA